MGLRLAEESTKSSVWQIVLGPSSKAFSSDSTAPRAVTFARRSSPKKAAVRSGTDHIAPNGLDIGAKRWHHVVLTFDSRSRSLQSYLNGKFLSKDPTNQSYDDKLEAKRITAFRSDVADPDNRVLNGSISLIRMYDRELDENEVRENFRHPHASQAVDAADKLATSWGKLKMSY